MLHKIDDDLITRVKGIEKDYIIYPLPKEYRFLEVQGVMIYNSFYYSS